MGFSERNIHIRHQLIFTSAISVLALSFIYFFILTQPLLIFTEARTYVANSGWSGGIGLLEYFFWPNGGNARFSSMILFSIQGYLGKGDYELVNWFQAGLLSITAFFAFIHTVQITKHIAIAWLTSFAWVFSGPVLGAALWQATQHDKLAALFIFSTLAFSHRVLTSKQRTSTSILSSFLILVLTSMAFNAKEISFLLPFMTIVLIWHLKCQNPAFNQNRAIKIMAPQFVYSAWYIIIYALNFKSHWSSHVMGGHAFNGLIKLILLMFNFGNFMDLGQWGVTNLYLRVFSAIAYAIFGVFLFAVCIIAIKRSYVSRGSGFSVRLSSIHDGIYFGALITITLIGGSKTAHPSIFYLLVTSWATCALIILSIYKASQRYKTKRTIVVLLGMAFFTPYLLSYVPHFVEGGAYKRAMDASRHIRLSFNAIKSLVDPHSIRHLHVDTKNHHNMEWFLFSDCSHKGVDQDLPMFLFNDNSLQTSISISPFVEDSEPAGNNTGDLVVFLDERLFIEKLLFEGQVLLDHL